MKSYVSMVAPIEQPMATFFLVGVPSMGCQVATSARCGSRTDGGRSVKVTSGELRWTSDPRCQLTVNSRLTTRMSGPRHRVKGHVVNSSAHAPGRRASRWSGGVGDPGEVLGRGRHVLLDDLEGSGHVALLDRVDDRCVPVAGHHRRLPGGVVEDGHAHPAHQTLPGLDEHGVAGEFTQPEVEGQVGLDPRRRVVALVPEVLQRGAQGGDGGVAPGGGDELPDGEPLQRLADAEQLAHLVRAQTADPQHAAVAGGDQPLLLQVPQRLADRAPADPQGTGQLDLAEVVPRAVTAGEDGPAERLQSAFPQGAAVQAGQWLDAHAVPPRRPGAYPRRLSTSG